MAIFNSRLNTLDERKLAANSSAKIGIVEKEKTGPPCEALDCYRGSKTERGSNESLQSLRLENISQVDFRSQPNTLSRWHAPAVNRTSPRPLSGPGGAIFPVEGMVEMCFDGSGGHAPPAARHLFPDSAGRSARLFRFSPRLGQRGIAPLCARPLDEPRRQVEFPCFSQQLNLGFHD